jgi:hypothetical protein
MSKSKLINVDFLPKCPHCEKELPEVGIVSTGALSITKILVCPHCKKVLGPIYRA